MSAPHPSSGAVGGAHHGRWLVAIGLMIVAAPVHAAPPSPAPPAPPPTTVVIARLAELPSSEACQGRRWVWTAARYTINRVISRRNPLRLRAGQDVLVHQLCPARARGFSGHARGDAGPLRPGQRQRLTLSAAPEAKPPRLVDPFDAALPRYRARRTNKAPKRPVIVLSVNGAGVSRKVRFAARGLHVGSAMSSDVLLAAAEGQHLLLKVRGPVLWVLPLGGAKVTVDGVRVPPKGVAITYKSKIAFGPYLASASLLTARFFRQVRRKQRR